MLDETKDVIDVAAASTALLTLAAWLPPTASILTIVWMVLRIYESDTVQSIVNGTNKKDSQLTKVQTNSTFVYI